MSVHHLGFQPPAAGMARMSYSCVCLFCPESLGEMIECEASNPSLRGLCVLTLPRRAFQLWVAPGAWLSLPRPAPRVQNGSAVPSQAGGVWASPDPSAPPMTPWPWAGHPLCTCLISWQPRGVTHCPQVSGWRSRVLWRGACRVWVCWRSLMVRRSHPVMVPGDRR